MNLKAKLQNPNPNTEPNDVEIVGFADLSGQVHGVFIRDDGSIGAAPSYMLKVEKPSVPVDRYADNVLIPEVDIRSTEPNQKIKPKPYQSREEIEKLMSARVPTQAEARRESKRRFLYGRLPVGSEYGLWETRPIEQTPERAEAKIILAHAGLLGQNVLECEEFFINHVDLISVVEDTIRVAKAKVRAEQRVAEEDKAKKLAEVDDRGLHTAARDAVHHLGGLEYLPRDGVGHYTPRVAQQIIDRVELALKTERQRAVAMVEACRSGSSPINAADALLGTIAARIAGATPAVPPPKRED